jgi:hypothetical protein
VRFKGPNNWDQQLDTAADKFSIRRNSVDFVVVDSSGNLGIGTSSPAGKLSSVVTAAGAASLTLERTASSRFEFQQGITAVTGDALRIIDTTLSRDYLMLRDGNLGIGTISPGQKLEVAGNILINTSGNPTMTVKTSGAGNNPGYLLTADTNTWGMYGIFSDANDTLQWQYNGTTRLTLTNDGNLGLGVTPSAWFSTIRALQIGSVGGASIAGNTSAGGSAPIGLNVYFDAAAATARYGASSFASRYTQFNGAHEWFTAPSGTAGNAISFTQAMTLSGTAGPALRVGVTADLAGFNFQAANQVGFSVHNSASSATAAYFSAAGNVTLTSAGSSAVVNGVDGILLGVNATERARITSGGSFLMTKDNVIGINTSDAADNGYLALFGAGADGTTRGGGIYLSGNERSVEAGSVAIQAGDVATTGIIAFRTGGITERARITSGGYSKFSNNGTYANSASYHEFYQTNNSDTLRLTSTSTAVSGAYGLYVDLTVDPNATDSFFVRCFGGATQRASIRSNGGLANYSGNDVNLSDRREKTNFAPAKSYLDTICAIPVQTFNYIDQSEDDPGLTLGVVAQDVQAVAPELVMESNWGTAEEPKMRFSIYQTDLQYALMKCVQELKAELDSVKAELATLKGQP